MLQTLPAVVCLSKAQKGLVANDQFDSAFMIVLFAAWAMEPEYISRFVQECLHPGAEQRLQCWLHCLGSTAPHSAL